MTLRTRAARVVTRVATGAAAGAAVAALAVFVSPVTARAADDPSLDQQIDPDQAVATDRAVLGDGHVDIGPRHIDGAWHLLVHDDRATPPVWRTMPQTVLQVSDASLTTVPDDPDYAFLPAEPGTDVHVVPQAQQPGVVWVGWNTQDPTVMDSIDRGATLTLRGVQGPGELVMFLQSGTLGAPEVLWDSRESYPQDVWVEVNTHTHANWVFSEPGVYLVEVEVSADLVSGDVASDTQVLRFAVGDGTSADDAFVAEYVPTAGQTDAAPTETAASDASAADGSAGVEPLLVAGVVGGVAATVLLAVVVSVAVRGRRAKRRAATLGPTPGTSTNGDTP